MLCVVRMESIHGKEKHENERQIKQAVSSQSCTLSFVDIGILMPIVSGITPQENVDLSGTAICLLDARRKNIDLEDESAVDQKLQKLHSISLCTQHYLLFHQTVDYKA